MSGISGVRLSGLSPQPANETSNDAPIKLRGITWNDKIKRQDENISNDNSNITPRNTGRVPVNNEIPMLFPEDNGQTQPMDTETKPQTQYTVKKDEGTATGIGMVVGGIAGGVVGSYLGKGTASKLGLKLGIGIGVAVGGYIGHKYE